MINFGVVKNQVTRELSEHFITNANSGAEKTYNEFLSAVKASPVLMMEYVVFKNLERRSFDKERAIKYIDDNIALFQKYDKRDIISENAKLEPFLGEAPKGDKLTEAIQTLILESASKSRLPNVNKIYDSLTYIVECMSKPELEAPSETEGAEGEDDDFRLNEIMAMAERKVNERLSHLNEEEREIVRKLSSNREEDHKELFEAFKAKALNFLRVQGESSDMLQEAVREVNRRAYNAETVMEDVLSFYELTN
jgi:hypothetical protein